MSYQAQEFIVVSKADLLASKIAAGRDIDLEDVKLLSLDDEGSTATTTQIIHCPVCHHPGLETGV